MKKIDKKEIVSLINVIGQHIEKYWIMMIIILGLICSFSIGFMIAWNASPDIVEESHEIAYYVAQGSLLFISLVCILIIVLNKKKIIKTNTLAVIFHIYAFVLMVWATLSFIFDLSLGFPEIIYLLIYTLIAGLFVVEPIFFCSSSLLSLITIVIVAIINPNRFFGGSLVVENIINLVAFVLAVITVGYRNYRVTISEFKQAKRLEEMSYIDELTGLLNERSYINEIEQLDKATKEGKQEGYAVVLMDVNNLKNTNDKYGHRYGCSLVVRCGHMIPTIFKTSTSFHVGGDEFISIIKGEDYQNFEKVMEEFDKQMLYSHFEYEGQTLIFSVARGFAKYEEGKQYKEVLQVPIKQCMKTKPI